MNPAAWWKSAVVYQIYPRSFQDSDGDGVGDLNGIIARLGDLQDLGVDTLWLSPIQTSPMVDFGYDISDYRGIDPLFGSMADFDRLLAEAHDRGMKILLDIVINHSSDQHPWFLESRSSRDNPKRDWYLWRDGERPPNNWLGIFGGSAWERDEGTGSWYLHSFLKEQPDLNWRNPELKKAVLADLEFWLEKGVDGFRFDVFNLWFKDPALRDNPAKLWGWKNLRPYDWQRHRYDGFHRDLHPVLAEIRTLLDRYGAMSVGETYLPEGWDPERSASYLGRGDELHLAFDFTALDDGWSARATAHTLAAWMKATRGPNWPALVYSNHDAKRAYSRLSPGCSPAEAEHRARLLAVLLLLWKGTPFLYYGEEIGLPQVRLKRSQIQDPLGLRYWPFHRGRDGARTPMAWNEGRHGGFTPGEPWLPLHPDSAVRNVETQRADPSSLWNWYASLLAFRKSQPAFQTGGWEAVELGHREVLAFRRTASGQSWLVATNFSSRPSPIVLESAGSWILGTRPRDDMPAGLHVLDAYEAVVLREQS